MGVREKLLEMLNGTPAEEASALRETAGQYADSMDLLQERLAELELSLEDVGFQRLTGEQEKDFSRAGLRKINQLSRLYWLKNPLIKRSVYIQTAYVFGQGVSVHARDAAVNEVVQAFLDDPKNQAELTSHQAHMLKETELQVSGNIFFAFFVNRQTGATRVRTIPVDEVDDIIYNPDDARDPWYYKRVRIKRWFDVAKGQYGTKEEITYHPDWRYKPKGGYPRTIGSAAVAWDVPVYHVAVNRLSDMKFGVSEVYAALDWAKAYKDFLQDWATIVKAYSRFAWNVTTKGGPAGVAAAKAKLNTTIAANNGRETNPPPAAASTWIATEGTKLEAIKTSGATTDAEDGRRLLLMVSAGTGIYEHYFGDPSTGNLATASSMERPMELMFRDRQTLWKGILLGILGFVLEQAARAAGGKLSGTPTVNEYGEEIVDFGELDRHIEVSFPPLLEKDIQKQVAAIISAGTLDGKEPAGLDLKTITTMLLQALGVDDLDEKIEELFPKGWEEDRAAKAAEKMAAAQQALVKGPPGQGDKEDDPADPVEEAFREAMVGAVREIREAVQHALDA